VLEGEGIRRAHAQDTPPHKFLLVSSDFSLFTADRNGRVVVVVVRGIIGVGDRVVRSSDSVGDGA